MFLIYYTVYHDINLRPIRPPIIPSIRPSSRPSIIRFIIPCVTPSMKQASHFYFWDAGKKGRLRAKRPAAGGGREERGEPGGRRKEGARREESQSQILARSQNRFSFSVGDPLGQKTQTSKTEYKKTYKRTTNSTPFSECTCLF